MQPCDDGSCNGAADTADDHAPNSGLVFLWFFACFFGGLAIMVVVMCIHTSCRACLRRRDPGARRLEAEKRQRGLQLRRVVPVQDEEVGSDEQRALAVEQLREGIREWLGRKPGTPEDPQGTELADRQVKEQRDASMPPAYQKDNGEWHTIDLQAQTSRVHDVKPPCSQIPAA